MTDTLLSSGGIILYFCKLIQIITEMRKGAFLLMLFTIFLGFSCSRETSRNIIITGLMTDASGQKAVLKLLGPDWSRPVDSATVDTKGTFTMNERIDSTGLYTLSLGNNPPLVLEINPGDTISLKGSVTVFPAGMVIEGSQNSKELLELLRISSANRRIIDSLRFILEKRSGEPGFAELSALLDQGAQSVYTKQWETQLFYIDTHFNSLTSLIALNQVLGAAPVMKFEHDSVIFIKLDSSLGRAFPGNPHVEFHHKRILKAREQLSGNEKAK